MTETTMDSSGKGCLVLILPTALLIIFLFATWPILLAVAVLGAGLNLWQNYQWQKWSQQVNPIFHQLIGENQGRITAMDLAMRANFSGETAKRYLETKAAEFGASTLEEDGGTVYYFITASTLGSIFDSSEPIAQIQDKPVARIAPPVWEPPPQQQQEQTESPQQATEAQPKQPLEKQLVFGSLIQSELAKRLNVYSSTVYKHRDNSDFPEWSRSRDPDGIAWTYSPDTKEFFPLEEEGKS